MIINKVDRKELKKMIVDILGKSATFKMLSNDDEINPCRISFDGMNFNIYIKNLSPAQLSNNNPDIWRIQLPIRDDFDTFRECDIPFIALGYDDYNKVFTTWNPYWVKQRLNIAKSVSLYSRLALQKIAGETQNFQKINLNNDGEVVAFPCSKLSYFLVNIKQFFPEMTDYVAMGSRKRTEANAAYRELCDTKNIAGFARYLADNGLSSSTINSYCSSIKRLINKCYFSQNRKVFLACDSLSEYPNVIESFLSIPEVADIDEKSHRQIANGFRSYIQFLLEKNNIIPETDELDDDDNDDNDLIEEDLPENLNEEDSASEEENENIDWEALFTNENGKLTRIANPILIDKLKPVLDTEYRKLSSAYNIVAEFYGDRYRNIMELKDWNNLFNQIDWQSPYYNPSEQPAKRAAKKKSYILKVTTPNGEIFEERKVSETLIKVIKYAGVDNVRDLNINVCSDNMIITEDHINPLYKSSTKYLGDGLYVNTCSDTKTKAYIIEQISKELNLGLTVQFVNFDSSNDNASNDATSVDIFSNNQIVENSNDNLFANDTIDFMVASDTETTYVSKDSEILLEKEVDWSLLNTGFTIPIAYHENWYVKLNCHPQKGESIPITLIAENGTEFAANLLHANQSSGAEVLQVLYASQNNPIKGYLKQLFEHSYNYIVAEREKLNGKKGSIHLPLEERQYLIISLAPKTLSISIKPKFSNE